MKKTSTFFQLTQKQFNLSITIVLLLTVLLRFYQLGQIPHGMTWDEAAIGYNGFAIFNTRRDEWLTRLPISFWSFGDYKAPLAIYLNGIFTHFFGMSLWSVRLPFALAGVGSVLGLIFLTQLLAINSNEKPERARLLSIMAGILLMFSPWHHHFSRIGFESGIALMFFIWGIYFFYHALIIKFSRQRFAIFTLSILNFVASIYTYHSAKITVPLTVLFLVIWRRRELKIYWRSFLMAGVIGLLTLYFFIHDALFGKGLERAGTLIFAQSNSWWQTIRLTLTNFKVHLSTSFLLQGATTTLRHGDGQWGVLFPTTFILIILGLWYLFWNKGKKAVLGISGLAIMILGILPAALGSEVPHSNRSLLALPGFIFLAIFGLQQLIKGKLSTMVKKSFLGMLILIHSLFFISYLNHYYTQFAAESASDFQDGYLETFRFILPYERGEIGKTAVDKIIFTSKYGQPYIYALFVRETNPIWYQGGSLIKYEFKEEINIGDLERPNTLVVASQTDDLLGRNFDPDKIIFGSDGSARFRIYLNQD